MLSVAQMFSSVFHHVIHMIFLLKNMNPTADNILKSINYRANCFFSPLFLQMLTYFAAFEVFFEENLPKLFAHFKKNNLTPDIYLIDW